MAFELKANVFLFMFLNIHYVLEGIIGNIPALIKGLESFSIKFPYPGYLVGTDNISACLPAMFLIAPNPYSSFFYTNS